MNDLAILKFGGTSVKSMGRIEHVADIVTGLLPKKCVVVLSYDIPEFLSVTKTFSENEVEIGLVRGLLW
ncbi:MAG TPA: hypothetical protein V6D17_19815 [Candidatus Obscuribacterales bacterium]